MDRLYSDITIETFGISGLTLYIKNDKEITRFTPTTNLYLISSNEVFAILVGLLNMDSVDISYYIVRREILYWLNKKYNTNASEIIVNIF